MKTMWSGGGGTDGQRVELDSADPLAGAIEQAWESIAAGVSVVLGNLERDGWRRYPELSYMTGGYRLVDDYTIDREGYFQWIGFLAGRLWLLAGATGRGEFGECAQRLATMVTPSLVRPGQVNADIGFDIYHGLCLGAEATGDSALRDNAVAATRSMSDLYMRGSRTFAQMLPHRATVIDTGAMLTSYLWAARVDGRLADLAYQHFLAVAEYGFIRADGTTAQRIEFGEDGSTLGSPHTVQGIDDSTTWSRGQAWGILGFVNAYECFGEAAFAEVADSLIATMLDRMGGAPVPRYDLDASSNDSAPLDTCSAAILASVLLRWSRMRDRPELERRGREILLELLTNHLSPGGVLLHGSWGRARRRFPLGRFPQEDVMPYGNYWVCEAMYRASQADWALLELGSSPAPAQATNDRSFDV